MSQRIQAVVVWWAVATAVIYGFCLIFLFDMVPPPTAQLSAEEIAAFYQERQARIQVGAMIAGWCSAFIMPLGIVCAVQIRRVEKGRILSLLTVAGASMMSIFLVLPPVFWGTAAFTPTRAPEITALMHELAILTLVTTDQYFLFMWIPIAVVCFAGRKVEHSPFPRWFGYVTVWTAIMFEAGAIAFLPRAGVFSWNGLFVFWSPLVLFGVWIAIMVNLLLTNLKRQRLAEEAADDASAEQAGGVTTAADRASAPSAGS